MWYPQLLDSSPVLFEKKFLVKYIIHIKEGTDTIYIIIIIIIIIIITIKWTSLNPLPSLRDQNIIIDPFVFLSPLISSFLPAQGRHWQEFCADHSRAFLYSYSMMVWKTDIQPVAQVQHFALFTASVCFGWLGVHSDWLVSVQTSQQLFLMSLLYVQIPKQEW